jgi:hypothetical protein
MIRIVLAVSLAAILLIVALPALYWGWLTLRGDDDLHAEAGQLLQPPATPASPDSNLFFAIVGFGAEDESGGAGELHQRGVDLIADFERGDRPGAAGSYGPTRAPVADADRLCGLGNNETAPYRCIEHARLDRDALTALVAEHRDLLDDYRRLWRYSSFANLRPDQFDGPLLSWPLVLQAKRLLHTEIALSMVDGEAARAVADLAEDLAMWRRVLGSDRIDLIDKMVAQRALLGGYLFAGEVLRVLPDEVPLSDRLGSPLSALTDAEQQLAGALTAEFRLQARLFMDLLDAGGRPAQPERRETDSAWVDDPRLLRAPLLQPNASLNRLHAAFQRERRADQMSCRQIRDLAAAENPPPPRATGMHWRQWLFNPVGNILLDVARPDYGRYRERLCDLLAVQRLTSLQLELRLRRLQLDDAAAVTLRDAASYHDPYTEAAFVREAEGLRFDAGDARTQALMPIPF